MALFEQRSQAAALAQLGNDVRAAIDAPVVNLNDVWVVQHRRLFGGLKQPFNKAIFVCQGSIEHLERYPPVFSLIERRKHCRNNTHPNELFDAITIVKDAVDHLGQRSGIHGAMIVLRRIVPRVAPALASPICDDGHSGRGRLNRGQMLCAAYDSGVDLPSARTRRLIIISMLAAAAALFTVAVVVYQGNPRSTDLPVAIQAVGPEPGSNVLSQTDVFVDLAVGYTADIDINGIKIPEAELFRVEGLNQLSYEPREGKTVPRLLPDQNCVRVFYWLIARGPEGATPYTWCFDAS
jgi:hypothetical protein